MTAASTRLTPIVRFGWVLLAVRAFLALGLGFVVLITNEIRPAMVNVIAVYWLLGSILTLRWARAHRHSPGHWVAYGAAVAGIVASVVIFARGLLSDLLEEQRMLNVMGALSVAIGLLRISGLFRESVTEELRRSRPEGIAMGVLEVALGIVLFFSVELRPIAIPIIGAWGLVGGSIMLTDALRARRAVQRAQLSPAPPGVGG